MSAYACPVASVLANVYADAHNNRLTYTPAHAWCSQHLLTCMHTLRKKCICARACAHMHFVEASLPRNYRELILNLARASCKLSFAARPIAVSTKSVAQRCLLKKSVQIQASPWRSRYCGVAHASCGHPRWCRPHPVCSSSLSRAHRASSKATRLFLAK